MCVEAFPEISPRQPLHIIPQLNVKGFIEPIFLSYLLDLFLIRERSGCQSGRICRHDVRNQKHEYHETNECWNQIDQSPYEEANEPQDISPYQETRAELKIPPPSFCLRVSAQIISALPLRRPTDKGLSCNPIRLR